MNFGGMTDSITFSYLFKDFLLLMSHFVLIITKLHFGKFSLGDESKSTSLISQLYNG
jgi:hypothetical protein